MNQFIAVFLALLSLAVCEPPRSTYGVPSAPSGWDTGASVTHYESHPVPHQTSEGAHIDERLLDTVKQVILASENTGSNGYYSGDSSGLSSVYGPPSHWSSGKVVSVDLSHPIQSHPVAYYLGKSYAPVYTGWVQKPSTGWAKQTTATWVERPSSSYGAPKPSISYGAPSW